jgi:L-amino acid N-acyltransferase YncA
MRIRMARADDAASIREIYRPSIERSHTSFELAVPTVQEMASRVQATLPAFAWLVCTRDDVVVGYAYADPYRKRPAYQWATETSVYVAEDARRLGVARALYATLLELLKRQGYVTAFAGIALPNAASIALHEAMGFERIGIYRRVGFKMGRWHDVGWWQRDLDPSLAAPAGPPVPASALVDTPEWAAALAEGERHLRRER